MYVDHGVSGARDKRPALEQCLSALQEEDTLVVATLDRLGRSTTHMLTLANELQERGISLKVLNLGGEAVDTSTPMGRMLFTVMVALAEMELAIKQERINDSIAKRRAKGGDLGGRTQSNRLVMTSSWASLGILNKECPSPQQSGSAQEYHAQPIAGASQRCLRPLLRTARQHLLNLSHEPLLLHVESLEEFRTRPDIEAVNEGQISQFK